MYGNQYAYYFTYNHQKVFDISNFLSISSIDLQFYQDEIFIDEFGDKIPVTYQIGQPGQDNYRNGIDNIYIDGVEVFLGLEANEIGKEKVICYTYDNVIYGKDSLSTVDRNIADKRQLQVAWVHQLDTDKYTVIDKDTDGGLSNYDGYHIYWYRQNWEEVEDQQQEKPYNLCGRNWLYLDGQDDKFVIDIVNDIGRNKEQYCAIVWSSDTKEISNVLEFKNQIDIDNTNNILKSDDALCFRIFKTANSGEDLVQDDTLFNFYCYDEKGDCTFTSDGSLWSNYWYYIQVYIKDPETLNYKPLRLDNNENIVVTWKTPLDDVKTNLMANLYGGGTMFQDFAVLNETEDSAYLQQLNADTIVDANTFTRKFKIKQKYDFRYNNNLIIASFTRNGINYSLSRQFNFGNAASMGSKYSIEILMDNPLGYAVSGKDCQLHVVIRNEEGKDVTSENVSNISWTVYPNTYDYTEKDSGILLLTNTDKWDMHPPIIKCKVINVAPYPLETIKGINVRNKDTGFYLVTGATGKKYYITSIVPDRIEYRSDGTIPRYSTGNFILQYTDPDNGNENYQQYINSYYKSVTYDIQHFIYQNNQWIQDTSSKDNFILSIVPSSSSEKLTVYTPESEYEYNVPKYKLSLKNPNAENGSEWLWNDDLRDKNIYYITTIINNIILYSQAVAFDRNLYSSSLVNNWNSDELSIDEDNNAVLAKMIGAGTKDAYNRFTGVLMGDFTDKSDGSINTGITGFRNGSQSFGFKTDGTGFIGEAGAGQITFDGNRAKISSADGNFYINLNPTQAITNGKREDGTPYSSQANYKSADQFFLFAKSPKKTSNRNTTSTTINTSIWYQKFVEDATNDYFVVDPVNGMFLSGGIIASYGKLGNWTINSQGMYQKNTEAQKYMFLGYNPSASKDGETNDTYAIFAGKNEYSDPVFSVSWDGHLKARSGIIGNVAQWHINDCGLTRKENQSIIHIGNGQAKDQDGKDLFTGTNDSNYNIFCAENDTINFGVTIGGYLFSRLGTIGGWNIDANRLYSTDNNIIFDSALGEIKAHKLDDGTYGFVLDKNGIVSIKSSENTGILKLSNYWFKAYTPETITIPLSYSKVDFSDAQTLGQTYSYDNSNSWDGGGTGTAGGKVKIITNSARFSSNDVSISENYGTLKIGYNAEWGLGLVTGKTSEGKKVVALYPDSSDDNYGSLGISGSLWNIYANNIFASSVNLDQGTLNANTLFMNQELVATQLWVRNQLNEVYNAINSNGNGVEDNAKSIKGLGSSLRAKAITSTKLINYGTENGTNSLGVEGYNADGFCVASPSQKIYVPAVSHSHAIEFSAKGGQITLTMRETSSLGTTASFNIADTAFYRSHAYLRLDLSNERNDTGGIGYMVKIGVVAVDGTTITTQSYKVSAQSAYSDGYDSGYSDGESSVSRPTWVYTGRLYDINGELIGTGRWYQY